MNYKQLAEELLSVQANFSHLPIGISISEISEGEHLALRLISENEDRITPSEISKTMRVSFARVSALLRRLEKKGLIKKIHSSEDERMVTVILTPQGKKLTEEKIEKTIERLCEVLEKLSPEDAAEYVRLRKAILSAAKE